MNLSDDELRRIGLRSVGRNCVVHSTVQFFRSENISLGENVRIDCFALISGGAAGVEIGSHIHIGAGCYLFGGGGKLVLEDFAGLSPRVSIFTASDDFLEGYLRGPIVSEACRKVSIGDVRMKLNSCVGTGSVVLPGVTIGENASAGALTVISRDVPDHAVVAGNPARTIAERDRTKYLTLMEQFRREFAARQG